MRLKFDIMGKLGGGGWCWTMPGGFGGGSGADKRLNQLPSQCLSFFAEGFGSLGMSVAAGESVLSLIGVRGTPLLVVSPSCADCLRRNPRLIAFAALCCAYISGLGRAL
jgi:hypothetical protein